MTFPLFLGNYLGNYARYKYRMFVFVAMEASISHRFFTKVNINFRRNAELD